VQAVRVAMEGHPGSAGIRAGGTRKVHGDILVVREKGQPATANSWLFASATGSGGASSTDSGSCSGWPQLIKAVPEK
jgi:hypothetical protein